MNFTSQGSAAHDEAEGCFLPGDGAVEGWEVAGHVQAVGKAAAL
jgi:hypothetical protein